MITPSLFVEDSNLQTNANEILSTYQYNYSHVETIDNKFKVQNKKINYHFKTQKNVPKLGVLLVGLGGNNGSSFVGGIIANKRKLTWNTKQGEKSANFYGSITQCSTTKIGYNENKEIYIPLNQLLPMVSPDNIVVSGWDISDLNLGEAVQRAGVFDYDLQQKLKPYLQEFKPMKAIYYPDFIAANQLDRATNVLEGNNKQEHLEIIRKNIRDFKNENQLDKVVVLWTANTERMCKTAQGVHDTAENILSAINRSESEISPSQIYAVASILEGCSYINGSPQNTIVEGIIQLAEQKGVFVVGDDFKSGQTKIKTALAEFLVGSGIKPRSIVSYNHLGNNDGKNLSEDQQFKSKEHSKSTCVDDILNSNKVLYPEKASIDHTVVIKYCPYTGDSKKAMDEYCSEIFMGGQHTLVLYNVCEDSLLATPIILDLILLTELFQRISFKIDDEPQYKQFHSVLSTLGYLCKAPLTAKHVPLVNALFRQKNGIENLFKICANIPIDDNTLLHFKCL